MKMNEFGCENGKKILLIHGAGTSYKMWTAQIKILSGEYEPGRRNRRIYLHDSSVKG